jgi:hypothetical protein
VRREKKEEKKEKKKEKKASKMPKALTPVTREYTINLNKRVHKM